MSDRARLFLAMVPLVAFYLVDKYLGLRAGIVAAMLFAAGDVAYHWFVHRTLNKVMIGMAAMVGVLGGLSLLSDDERFFLYSPVVGDVVFSIVLLISVLRGTPLMLTLAETYQPADDPLLPEEKALMAGLTWRLALNLLVHAAWTAWATTQPRETWLFVSGPGQYLLFALQVLGEVLWIRWSQRE